MLLQTLLTRRWWSAGNTRGTDAVKLKLDFEYDARDRQHPDGLYTAQLLAHRLFGARIRLDLVGGTLEPNGFDVLQGVAARRRRQCINSSRC